jgi:hypothetical protein
MKTLFITLLGIAALLPIRVSAQCVKDFVPNSRIEEEVVRVENEWCVAAVTRDSDTLRRIFADNICWIEDTGYRNKEQVMNRYLVEVQEHSWELTDIRIRVIGNAAIVSSHLHVKKTVSGKFTETDHTSVDVFEKRNGHRQLVVES